MQAYLNEYRIWHEQGKQMIYPTKQPKGDIEDHMEESWYLMSQVGELQDYFNAEPPKLTLPTREFEGFSLVEAMDLKPLFYVNFKDKNDNKIYDGDVLEDGAGYFWEVKFGQVIDSFLPGWYLKRIGTEVMRIDCPKVIKIVGNIYETPEILELVDLTNKGEKNEPSKGSGEGSSEVDAASSPESSDATNDTTGGSTTGGEDNEPSGHNQGLRTDCGDGSEVSPEQISAS